MASFRYDSTESGVPDDEELNYVSMPLIKRESITKRKYQQAIFDSCKESNSLIVLPTGLGKTVIATMIAAHRLLVSPTSKVIFLAPTKSSLKHNKEIVLSFLDLDYSEIRLLTGDEAPEHRVSMWFEGKVIFATPQAILSDLSKGAYDLRNVSLVIFDEAHRAIGKYPYVELSQEYFRQSEACQVIGLTASPGWSEGEIAEIEKNLRVEKIEARTEMSMDVVPFVRPVDVQWVRVQLGPELALVGRLIDEMIDERLKELVNYRLIKEDDLWRKSRRAMVELQRNLADQARNGPDLTPMATYQGLTLTAQVIRLSYAREFLNTQGLYALSRYLDKLTAQSEFPRASNALKEIVGDVRFAVLTDTVRSLLDRGVKHPKLTELLRILDEQVRKDPYSRILVFAQYRDTVRQIVDELRKQGISAVPFIGQRRGKGFAGMTQKKQVSTLRNFKDGLYSILVATSVAEEGLDIAECNVVVLYDAVPSEVRYIQRRGRISRQSEGKVVTLITAGTQDERYYLSAISKEKKMRDVISRIKETKTTRIEDFVFGSQEEANKATRDHKEDNGQSEDQNEVDEKRNKHIGEGLTSTFEGMNSQATLVADNSVVNSRLFNKLRDSGCHLIIRTTRGADYIIGDDVGIIYVNHKDLRKSNDSYKAFLARVDIVKEAFCLPILIYEGNDHDQTEYGQSRRNFFYDAITYFTVIKRMHTIAVANENEVCNLISSLLRLASHQMREKT